MTYRTRAVLPWLFAMTGLLLASCSEVLSTDDSSVDRVSVNPASVDLTVGETRTITAQAFDDAGQRLVDRQLFWSTQNAAVATVSQSGVITGVASGNTQVAASTGGKSAVVAVSVAARPVTLVRVTPSTASVQTGRTVTLAAEGLDASGAAVPGRQVTWSTGRPSVATVSTAGVVTGVSSGQATITATIDGIEGTSVVSVTAVPAASVSIAPNSGSVVQGGALQLSATVRDAQGNTLAGRPVTWSSSDESVASVSSSGRVVGIAEGSFTITARSDAASGTGAYTVTRIPVGRVTVSPVTASIAVGQVQPLTVSLFAADQVTPLPVSGRTIAWTSSQPSVATVSASGSVTGVATGSATITAAVEGKSGTSTVTVTAVPIASITIAPTTASVVEGATTTLVATARDANNNVLAGRTFFWSSSNAAQLSVSQSGVVTAAVGSAGATATINASAPGGGAGGSTPSASANVDATFAPVASVSLAPTSANITVGGTATLTPTLRAANNQVLGATGRTITWKSLNSAVATVSASGVVTGVSQGSAVIEVSASSPGQGTPAKGTATVTVSSVPVASVTVTPSALPVYVGYTRTFTAVTKDANGNVLQGRAVQWGSSDNLTATVGFNSGDVTGVKSGPVTVEATSEGVKGSASITVGFVPIASVVVTPATATLDLTTAQTQQLAASPRDGNGQAVTGAALGPRSTTWDSDNKPVATVSGTGLVTPAGVGSATISATIDGVQGTSDITVTQSVGSVVFTAAAGDSLLLPAGNLTRTVTVFDGGGLPLSGRTVTFSAGPSGLVDITPASGTTNASGQVTITVTRSGAASGTATLTATSGTKSDQVNVRVLAAVTSIALAPAADSLFAGGSIDFTATAFGGTVPLVGRKLNISSGNTGAAVVAPAFFNTDVAGNVAFTLTSVNPGSTKLTVWSMTELDSVSRVMRVLAPATSVVVSPSSVAMVQDDAQSFTADVRSGPPTKSETGRAVTWATSNPAKLSIDQTGAAVALDSGTVTVTATALNDVGVADDVSDAATVTITLAPIATVTITPSPIHALLTPVPVVVQAQIVGGVAARGRACTLKSLNTAVAAISPATATTDLNGEIAATVTPSFLGNTTIEVKCELVTASAPVSVP
ncbi:MAG TPA: Ig-like domain-containing protein [Gemmatimonadaceae bacterium]|nr:Ig-like domain-containing protein [Gemmatimonadaceae bacterium]